MEKLKNLLEDDGVLAFSFFGPKTFKELQSVIYEVFGDGHDIPSTKFLGEQEIKEVMEQLFGNVVWKKMTFQKRYADLIALIRQIKNTGTRGQGLAMTQLWTPAKFKKMEECYVREYGDICVTYEVFCCVAGSKRG